MDKRPSGDPFAGAVRPMRGGSEAMILQEIDKSVALTRQELIALTGLSRSTVAETVTRLREQGLLAESRSARAGRGRPAQLLRRADPGGLLLGLDFGHEHLGVGVGSPDGVVLREKDVPASVDRQPRETMRLAREVALELLAQEGTDLSGVAHAVAGMPGPMNDDGVLQIPSLLGNGAITEPGRALQSLFHIPVVTFNDTALGAYGEMFAGAATDIDTFLFIKASHGVGAAVVIDGRLHTGATGLAGEIGHTRVAGATQRCRCGNVGCLETMAGIDGLVAELPAPYGPKSLSSPSTGDAVVDRVVTDAGRAVGGALAGICNALNPSLIITGGVLGSTHGAAFTKGVREAIDRLAQPAIAQAVTVVPATLGLRAEIVGSILLARRAALA